MLNQWYIFWFDHNDSYEAMVVVFVIGFAIAFAATLARFLVHRR